jgi:hypothetical protein
VASLAVTTTVTTTVTVTTTAGATITTTTAATTATGSSPAITWAVASTPVSGGHRPCPSPAVQFGLRSGLGAGFVWGITSSVMWPASFAWRQLRRSHRFSAVALVPFLEDARSRGFLRAVGAVYQFRYATLQDQLAGELPPVVDHVRVQTGIAWLVGTVHRDTDEVGGEPTLEQDVVGVAAGDATAPQ